MTAMSILVAGVWVLGDMDHLEDWALMMKGDAAWHRPSSLTCC